MQAHGGADRSVLSTRDRDRGGLVEELGNEADDDRDDPGQLLRILSTLLNAQMMGP